MKKISKITCVLLLSVAALGGLVTTAVAFSGKDIVDAVIGVNLANYLSDQSAEASTDAVPAELQNQPASSRNLRFTLYDVGILPRETKIGAGKLNLMISNFSGWRGAVRIVRDDGSEVSGAILQSLVGQTRSLLPVILPPGKYRLVMVEKPENYSSIIVTGSGE